MEGWMEEEIILQPQVQNFHLDSTMLFSIYLYSHISFRGDLLL